MDDIMNSFIKNLENKYYKFTVNFLCYLEPYVMNAKIKKRQCLFH